MRVRGRRVEMAAAAAGGLLVVLALALLLRPVTPRIAFNDGLGYDGQHYAAMVDAMRGDAGPVLAERPHYAHRPLPPAIVAASGLDVIRGFLLMNLVSLALAGALLALTVQRVSGGLLLPLAAVLWWAVLPGSVRYALYYPVLVDGVGLLLLFALVYAVAARLPWLFAALIGPAMLARENLVVLLPMLWLALLTRGLARATAWTALATAVAVAALLWVRLAPPVPAAEAFDALAEARQNLSWFFGNAGERALRFASAWLLALGLFALVPLLTPRASAAFLRREPIWAYYLAATAALIVVIGGDYDRYFLYLVPGLAVLAFGAAGPVVWHGPALLAVATAGHLLVARSLRPVGTSEEAYLAYNIATMEVAQLLAMLAGGAVVAALTAAVLLAARRRRAAGAA